MVATRVITVHIDGELPARESTEGGERPRSAAIEVTDKMAWDEFQVRGDADGDAEAFPPPLISV